MITSYEKLKKVLNISKNFKKVNPDIIHSFHYAIPEAVSFHLLNIANQWNLSPEDITVKISGLLETQSAMYTEILKYFLRVELELKPAGFQYDFAFDNFPQHFFSPVFSLAVCVL